jgi:hypothetical protein
MLNGKCHEKSLSYNNVTLLQKPSVTQEHNMRLSENSIIHIDRLEKSIIHTDLATQPT